MTIGEDGRLYIAEGGNGGQAIRVFDRDASSPVGFKLSSFSSSGFDSEHTSASNRIVVAVEERDGSVVVEVSDNGRDLTGEEALHAFDPFFRSSVRGAGVGVGLGVARSVAITLGGEVTLAQRMGGGAVITMRLPPAPPPAHA